MTVLHEPDLRSTLPGPYYTSPAMLAIERERLFSKSWLCVGRADSLAKPGQAMSVEVADESVLVVRDRSGNLNGFFNVCRHRGTRLCATGPAEFRSTIRCPYHGWAYGLDGRLLAAPNLRDMPSNVKARHGLHRVGLTTWAGYIWICLDHEADSLAAQIEPQLLQRFGTLELLERYGLEDLGLGKRIVYDVHANWKTLVENFTECYHCRVIHPELTAAVPEFASGYGSISGGRGHGAKLADKLEGFSRSGRATRRPLPGLKPDDRLFYGVILLPNVFLILVPDHIAFFRLEPLEPDLTRVTCDWLFEQGALADPAFNPSDAVDLLDITNRQDFEVCERCQLGMRSRSFRDGGVLVPQEHLILDFYDYLAREIGLAERESWPARPEDLALADR
jgi:glycine betaine catabolism A